MRFFLLFAILCGMARGAAAQSVPDQPPPLPLCGDLLPDQFKEGCTELSTTGEAASEPSYPTEDAGKMHDCFLPHPWNRAYYDFRLHSRSHPQYFTYDRYLRLPF